MAARGLRYKLALAGPAALLLMAAPCGAVELDASISQDLAAPELEDAFGRGDRGASRADGDEARINQRGRTNKAVIRQGDGGAQQAAIRQYGNGHSAAIVQGGGSGNQALIVQRGSQNKATIEQRGNRNDAVLRQRGRGYEATITQIGNGNSINIPQPPRYESLRIRQENGTNISVKRLSE